MKTNCFSKKGIYIISNQFSYQFSLIDFDIFSQSTIILYYYRTNLVSKRDVRGQATKTDYGKEMTESTKILEENYR